MAFPVGWTKKCPLVIDNTKVSGSADLTNFPVLLTEANFPSTIFDNTQGKEINTNYLLNDANLQGYWRLESDGTDSSSNNYTLIASADSGSVTYAAGKFGNGVDLENSSTEEQYLYRYLVNSTALNTVGSQTWSAWVKPESAIATNVLSVRESSALVRRILITPGTNASFQIAGLSDSVVSPNASVAGLWNHIVGRYNASTNKLAIFVNGVKTEVTVTGSPSAINNAVGDFEIGAAGQKLGISGQNADGIIDDVAIFDRALTDGEILGIYKGGQDLRFTSDEAGTTELCSETVNWDIVNDKAEVWVKIPTVDCDADTTFYAWYDNDTATPYEINATYGSQNVWNTNYKIVSHMEGSGTVITDSTASALNGTKFSNIQPAQATGLVGNYAQDFDGTDDYIEFAESAIEGDQQGTVTAWINADDYSDGGRIFSAGDEATTTYYFDFYTSNATSVLFYRLKNNDTEDRLSGNTELTEGNSYFVAIKSDGSTISMFVNGTKQTLTTSSGGNNGRWLGDIAGLDNATLGILKRSSFAAPFGGIIDEFHYSNDDRTDDWIITEYNNQNSPATFVTEGTETWGSTTTSTSTSTSTSSSSTSSSSSSSTTTVAGTSTSTSTSSSSSSSTSSSSTTTEQVEDYSRGDYAILGTDDTDLENAFTWTEYQNVATNNGVRVAQTATNEFAEFLFKNKNDNTTDSIQVTWDGQSSAAPSSSTVYLQIYNRTTEEWETKDSDSTTGADTDFELTFTITVNLNNYYDGSGWVACRVYQEGV